jgi:hypothetical protein
MASKTVGLGPLDTGYEHSYLVYDPDGNPATGDEQIFRGGPAEGNGRGLIAIIAEPILFIILTKCSVIGYGFWKIIACEGEKTMSSLIKNLFFLPPVEKRRDISRSWINPVFNGRMTKDHDDLYIYWRCYVISAVVCFSYVITYQINYFFGLGWPLQFFSAYDPVRNFSYSYSLMSIPLTLFIMAYGFLSLKTNLDLKTFDLTWLEIGHLESKESRERRKKLLGVSDPNAPRVIRGRFWIVLFSLPVWGWGSTIVLSYYEGLAYSWPYHILVGFILAVPSVALSPFIPFFTATFYQLRKGWFNPVITHPSNT